MKKPSRTARPVIDSAHLIRLHQEAIVQLTLFRSSLTASAETDGEVRDLFDRIAATHTNTYLDLLHTVGLHDNELGKHFSVPPPNTPYPSLSRLQHIRLADTLIGQHRTQILRLHRPDSVRLYTPDALQEEKAQLAALVRLLACEQDFVS